MKNPTSFYLGNVFPGNPDRLRDEPTKEKALKFISSQPTYFHV